MTINGVANRHIIYKNNNFFKVLYDYYYIMNSEYTIEKNYQIKIN